MTNEFMPKMQSRAMFDAALSALLIAEITPYDIYCYALAVDCQCFVEECDGEAGTPDFEEMSEVFLDDDVAADDQEALRDRMKEIAYATGLAKKRAQDEDVE
jgi:hypothetical protein